MKIMQHDSDSQTPSSAKIHMSMLWSIVFWPNLAPFTYAYLRTSGSFAAHRPVCGFKKYMPHMFTHAHNVACMHEGNLVPRILSPLTATLAASVGAWRWAEIKPWVRGWHEGKMFERSFVSVSCKHSNNFSLTHAGQTLCRSHVNRA